MTHTPSQTYLSTRGGSAGCTFEEVVLKGLAADGGLFVPEAIPSLPESWETEWANLSFADLALRILSLYISDSEIPENDLRAVAERSYAGFRHESVTPLVELEKGLWLLELFHGPTFAFKDVALQFLGNLFEYFLVRRNKGKTGKERHHLTVIGATSGDTGSAAIYGLRGKKDVSVFILHPEGRVSPIQKAQMTTVLDPNVHNISVQGSFDDCQDIVKALFADRDMNATHNVAAVNSINWARILAQMTYYFHAYFSLLRTPSYKKGAPIRFVVPSGNFGDILAGWFAKGMGLPIAKLIIATNSNDILDRFFHSGGSYTKTPVHGAAASGGIPADGATAHGDGVKETLSPAMDILVSSNFERLLWFLAFQTSPATSMDGRRKAASASIATWMSELKSEGGFSVGDGVIAAAKKEFESERVSDEETVDTIRDIYSAQASREYVLDPHSAIGVAASLRSMARNDGVAHVSLATAHPAKFSNAVTLALKDEGGFDFAKVLPEEFVGLEDRDSRVTRVEGSAGWVGVREIVKREVEVELKALNGAGER